MKDFQLRIILTFLFVILSGQIIVADTLYTIDNKVYEGKMVAFKYGTVYFNVYKFGKMSRTVRFPLFRVHKVVFNPREEGVESLYEIEQKYKRMRRGKRLRTIILRGDEKWLKTGINLKKNQSVLFSISGFITIKKDHKVYQFGELEVIWNKKKQLPTQPTGAVIAKIGKKGIPFYIGNNKAPFVIKKKGTLFLGINDFNLTDNSGKFTVRIYY